MNITLYQYKDKPNRVDKTPFFGVSQPVVSGNLVDSLNEKNPVFKASMSSNFDDYNYFKLNDKYYFIDNIEYDTNNIAIITGRLDVLMTEKTAILNMYAYIKRRTGGSDLIQDDMNIMRNDKLINHILLTRATGYELFGDGSQGTYILTTAQTGYDIK